MAFADDTLQQRETAMQPMAVARTPQKAPQNVSRGNGVAPAPRSSGLMATPGKQLTSMASNLGMGAPTNPIAVGEAMQPMPAPTSLPAGMPGKTPGAPVTDPIAAMRSAMPGAPAQATQGLGPGAAGTATDPNNPLTAQTLSRAPTADRFQLAQDRFAQFTEQTDPAYKAALRDTMRAGAAAGGLGSGQLRTSLGDAGNQRDLNLRTAERGFLTDALEGTIADSFGDVGIAQQQQGFQNQQQQQAFENELRRLGFDDAMINSAFGRGLSQWQAGQAGGTGSATGMAVGGQNAQAGGDALQGLMDLIKNQNAAPTIPSAPPATPGFTPDWRF